MRKELLNSSSLFDFVRNNGHSMTKDELITIAMEAICVANNDQAIKDNLAEWYLWDEDNE